MSRIKGPYSTDGIYVFAKDNFMFAEMRGWGGLTGGGRSGMRLSEAEAEEVQKANAQFMVDAMNEKEAREKATPREPLTKEQCEAVLGKARYDESEREALRRAKEAREAAAPVPVVAFPKPCPRCGKPMRTVQKMSGSWSECSDEKCDGEAP
ncbi:MAG: hypothetical protein WC986_14690 [Elusimicrobiota bacterium]|jgi:hypothetical protein